VSTDHHEIVQLTHKYCWALDSRTWDGLDQVFLPDATADLRSPLLEGRDAIRARIARALEPLDATQHTVTNHMIEVEGDRATCRCYLHAQHVREAAEGSPNYVLAGRYEDELVRTPEGWRISFRRLVVVWSEGNVDVVRLSR
jgi:3-phenylpropionate/cinnamic acid dioxygenase small subunit